MHDLVIRGGKIVDGSGEASRSGDVAIDGDRIAAVGHGVGPGRREIDADGQLVTPGWVDVHTHYDGQVTWDPHLTPTGWNGVTTIVMGNCGVGFAPAAPNRHDWLIQLMEGVEDIPGSALSEGMKWEWETFPEYLDAIETKPLALDVGTQVPHGAVRAYVMGDRGAKNEPATTEDIEKMCEIVKEGLLAGALGFSSSRTLLHRAKDGEPVPGTFAGSDELLGIGRAMAEVGYGVFEVASDLAPEGKEIEWMRALGRLTGSPVTFACLQNDFDPLQWRRMLDACEEDAREGGTIVPQVAQRPAGLLVGLESSVHPFMFYAGFAKVAALPLAERVAKMKTAEVRAAILDNPPDVTKMPPIAKIFVEGFHKIFVLGDPPDYEPGKEKSIQGIAEKAEKRPAEVMYDLMLENDGHALLYLPFLGYSNGNFDDMREMMMHPQAVFGLSDGGAHCGLICDASMPTYLLTHWVRDRSRGERIPLEMIVHAQARKTGELFGIRDRGLLAPGFKADVNVIDFENLHIHAPEMVYDLPASAKRLIQKVDGYRYTICSGEVTYEDGVPTGAMPGKLIRGPQPGSTRPPELQTSSD